jgi:hypothetical protein
LTVLVAADDVGERSPEAPPAPPPATGYKIQREKIYLGDAADFSSPAVLEALRVYQTIPAYRNIVDRKLTRDDPEYWPLMRHASSAFVRGLKSVCARRGHDLVGESGAIKPETEGTTVPEITDDVIEAVRADRIVRVVRGIAGDAAEEDAGEHRELVNYPEL